MDKLPEKPAGTNYNHEDWKMANPKEYVKLLCHDKLYLIGKQLLDVATVLIFAILICILCDMKILNGEAASALVGLMIGYILSEIKHKVVKD